MKKCDSGEISFCWLIHSTFMLHLWGARPWRSSQDKTQHGYDLLKFTYPTIKKNCNITKKAHRFPFFFRSLSEAGICCPSLVEEVEEAYYAENKSKIERSACWMLMPG